MPRISLLVIGILLSASGWTAQNKPQSTLILKVDETTIGPNAGQKSSSCLRIYADGKVTYARWWNSSAIIVDSVTNEESRPEYTVSVEHHLTDTDVWELSRFLQSKPVARLAEKFGPPHPAIDYFEQVTASIMSVKGQSKTISTQEYYTADLAEKSRYPSALILLMDRINEIETEAKTKGRPTEIPADCLLKRMGDYEKRPNKARVRN